MTEHRPLAHLRPERGWINDPTGPLTWRGRTHLFFQHNPDGGYWDRPHWGHVVSDDLVHWQRRPIALSPGPEPADAHGCYSGSAVVDGDRAVIVYTGVPGPVGPTQVQATCLAVADDELLDRWDKHPDNPVTPPPADRGLVGFRDPFVWHEDGRWWQLVGTGLPDAGGAVLVFTSDDLQHWTEQGVLLTGADLISAGIDPPAWTGSMWECPALVQIDGTDVLLVSVHDGHTTHYPLAILGDRSGTRFTPRRTQRVDLGPDLYAPCVLVDPTGRVISWGWSWEARTAERQRDAGWAGVLSCARQLRVHDDVLHVAPLPELAGLRGDELSVTPTPTPEGWSASGIEGDALDLELSLGPAADHIVLRLARSPGLEEVTELTIDRSAGELTLDRDRASLDPASTGGRVGGPIRAGGGHLDVRVLFDRSIVEVFVGGREALTARVYPTRADSRGVEVAGAPHAVGDVTLRAWPLTSIWAGPGG